MTLTKPYEATFYIGNDSKKTFSFLFDEVSENFIKVVVKRIDGTIYTPTFSVDMELKEVVFGEDEITPTADDIICIYRDTPTIQDTQFNTLQGYNAKALENILSKIVAMIQEMKASGFSTQILQGEPWGLDLIKPDDDGASVQIDYQARVLKKGLYFKMSDGNLQASANGVDFVQMPKSAEVKEFRHRLDADGNVHFEYRVDKDWIAVSTGADVSGIKSQVDKNTADIITINGKLSAVDAQIDANADAILKTREDFASADQAIRDDMNAEDSRLQTQITAQATAITTNKNDIDELGDDVAEIQAKIPESASGTNHLITKQQLLDEEMDIRDDLNGGLSELQTQITAQAAKIETKQDQLTAGDNIIISNNVISATGAGGGAGFDVIVVQELPAEGQKGIIYLLAKDGTAPDVYDEYVWITATQTFELIGTTQVDLSDYATKEDLNAVLPDQTDNAGKFLTTDGTEASWSDKPLVNLSTNPNETLVLLGSDSGSVQAASVILGKQAKLTSEYAGSAVAVGAKAIAGSFATAIGAVAKAEAIRSIQIGYGTNSDTNTFKVGNANGNFEIMSADGTIPAERMSATAGTTGQVLTKTDAGMEWQDATGGELPDNVLVNNASVNGGIAIGLDSSAAQATSVSIGNGAGKNYGSNLYSVAVGASAQAGSLYSTAIGGGAIVSNSYAVQIGKGTNTEHGTVCFGNKNGNFTMMSADGTIPADRIGNLDFGTMD